VCSTFRLQRTAPAHGSHLMALLAHRLRLRAFAAAADGYSPTQVPVDYLATVTGYPATAEGVAAATALLTRAGGVVVSHPRTGAAMVDCRATAIRPVHELVDTEVAQLAARAHGGAVGGAGEGDGEGDASGGSDSEGGSGSGDAVTVSDDTSSGEDE
jgi:uncharacterized membrane protein YgcG